MKDDNNKKDPVNFIGSLTISLEDEYPSDLWEKIEDAVVQSLFDMGLKGIVENSVTGNSIFIQQLTKGKL